VRVSVLVLSTAGFDRLLLALVAVCLAQDGQKGDRDLKAAGNLANVGSNLVGSRTSRSARCAPWPIRYPPTFRGVGYLRGNFSQSSPLIKNGQRPTIKMRAGIPAADSSRASVKTVQTIGRTATHPAIEHG
jgi:hypothetical protein